MRGDSSDLFQFAESHAALAHLFLLSALVYETSAKTTTLTEEETTELEEVTEETKALEAAVAATPKSAQVARATIEQKLIEKRKVAIDLKPTGSRVDS